MVPALVRMVHGAGGFATILCRGSAWGAAMLIVHRHGPDVQLFERLPLLTGGSVWQAAASGEDATTAFIERQRRFDPDLWVVELDIADPARFIPGFPPAG